eukprot:143315-Pyramimonas_sp.AAC.1
MTHYLIADLPGRDCHALQNNCKANVNYTFLVNIGMRNGKGGGASYGVRWSMGGRSVRERPMLHSHV